VGPTEEEAGWAPLKRRLVGPHSWSERCAETKIPDYTDPSLSKPQPVAIPTALFRPPLPSVYTAANVNHKRTAKSRAASSTYRSPRLLIRGGRSTSRTLLGTLPRNINCKSQATCVHSPFQTRFYSSQTHRITGRQDERIETKGNYGEVTQGMYE
jgi:hypothetical protein